MTKLGKVSVETKGAKVPPQRESIAVLKFPA
jgi:hypothetical protein